MAFVERPPRPGVQRGFAVAIARLPKSFRPSACFVNRNPPTLGGKMNVQRHLTQSIALACCSLLFAVDPAQGAETIKDGIRHSLAGTMAISETSLKDVALMTIAEINAKGGVLRKNSEPVGSEPASNA